MISIMRVKKNIITKEKLQTVGAIIIVLTVWYVLSIIVKSKILLPSPVDVLKRFFILLMKKEFWSTISFSFLRISIGFFSGFILGTVFAIAAKRFRLFEIFLRPFVTTIKTVPVASFIVLCLVWLTSSKLSAFISFLMVFPVIYSNILEGLKNTDKLLIEAAHIYDMHFGQIFKYIYLPALRPHIVSACSIALGLSWKAGIAAEIIGIPEGSVGEMFYNAKIYLDSTDLLAWTLTVVIVSVLFEKIILYLISLFYKKLFATENREELQ